MRKIKRKTWSYNLHIFLPPPQKMRVEVGVDLCKQACYISKYGIQYLDILRPR